jgi:hypothetical protein
MKTHVVGRRRSLDERFESALTRTRSLRFQLWALLLAAMLALAAMLGFAALAIKGDERSASPVARFANGLARAPVIAHRLFSDIVQRRNPRLALHQRFKGRAGFSAGPDGAPPGALLVLSRYDGDQGRGIVEIVNLDDGSAAHAYAPDIRAMNALSRLEPDIVNLARDFNERRYMMYSPTPTDDGGLVFHGMDSPLVKIDVCSRPVWTVDGIFHHSIARDAEGNFWSPQNLKPPTIANVDADFQDDALVQIAPDGEVLFRKSLAEILIKSGLGHIVYSHDAYDPDPLHLNDIEPALSDGPYWRKGDIFLSVRNPSMVALYRPAEDRLLWWKQGPWLLQHDVDIVSERQIAVFDNHAAAAPAGETVLGFNDYKIYDFASGRVSSPYAAGFSKHKIRTPTNGLAVLLPDRSLMVEEQNYGRIIAIDETGRARWSFVNRAKDGRVYQLGWSQVLAAPEAAALKRSLASAPCRKTARAEAPAN